MGPKKQNLEKMFYKPDLKDDVDSDSSSDSKEDTVKDSHKERTFQLLEDQRKLYLAGLQDYFVFFHITLLGGGWTQEKKSREVAEFMGSAKGVPARNWCQLQRMPKSARFEPNNYGGMDHALALAKHWTERMEYFYSFAVDSNIDLYEYTEGDVQGFKPSRSKEELLAPLEGKFRKNAEKVLSIIPFSAKK